MIGRLKRAAKRMSQISTMLKISAVLTLVGLAFMVWSMLEPTPMPVILAMSVGQGLGTLAFALFGLAVLIDQLRKQRAKGKTMRTDEIAVLIGDAPPSPRDAHNDPVAARPLHDVAQGSAPDSSRGVAP